MTREINSGGEAESSKAVSVRLFPWSPANDRLPPESGIGERLKYARSELSLSVEALSRLTKTYDQVESKGVSPSSLLRYENGDSLPGARELRLLCAALEVPVQWLLLGELPTGGSSPAQQALLAALISCVQEAVRDYTGGSIRASQFAAIGKEIARAARLDEARRPPTP